MKAHIARKIEDIEEHVDAAANQASDVTTELDEDGDAERLYEALTTAQDALLNLKPSEINQ